MSLQTDFRVKREESVVVSPAKIPSRLMNYGSSDGDETDSSIEIIEPRKTISEPRAGQIFPTLAAGISLIKAYLGEENVTIFLPGNSNAHCYFYCKSYKARCKMRIRLSPVKEDDSRWVIVRWEVDHEHGEEALAEYDSSNFSMNPFTKKGEYEMEDDEEREPVSTLGESGEKAKEREVRELGPIASSSTSKQQPFIPVAHEHAPPRLPSPDQSALPLTRILSITSNLESQIKDLETEIHSISKEREEYEYSQAKEEEAREEEAKKEEAKKEEEKLEAWKEMKEYEEKLRLLTEKAEARVGTSGDWGGERYDDEGRSLEGKGKQKEVSNENGSYVRYEDWVHI